jgi:hypothetical protein
MAYTQVQLNPFWQRYVVMDSVTVIQLTNPSSPAFEKDFAGMLYFCQRNHLYGFAEYTVPCSYPNTQNCKFTGRFGG